MKYFLFTVSAIAMFFTLSSCGQAKTPVNCSKYKTGTFFYHFTMNEAEFHFTLKRNDSLQSETNEKSGKAVRFKVNWIDSCTYELRYLDGLEELPKETISIIIHYA